jgi:hypothetical protein
MFCSSRIRLTLSVLAADALLFTISDRVEGAR